MIRMEEMKEVAKNERFIELLNVLREKKDDKEIYHYIVELLRESAKEDKGYVSLSYKKGKHIDMSQVCKNEMELVIHEFEIRGYDVTVDNKHKKLHIDMTNTDLHDTVRKDYSVVPYARDMYGFMPSHYEIKRDEYLEEISNQIFIHANKGITHYETEDFGFGQPLDNTTIVQNAIIETLKENGYHVEHKKLDDIEILKREMVDVLRDNGYDIKHLPYKPLYSLVVSW